jgi:hypothetical protein
MALLTRLSSRRASAVTGAVIVAILVASFMPWPLLVKMALNIIGLGLAIAILVASRHTPVSSSKTK